jgi:hypothetical protein
MDSSVMPWRGSLGWVDMQEAKWRVFWTIKPISDAQFQRMRVRTSC